MALARVAIVGRPNVGKSSLFNRLAHRRVSIVDPTPGVTRDRVSVVIEIDPLEIKGHDPRRIELIDTGGYGVYGDDPAAPGDDIERQIAIAVAEADTILLVTDAQEGLTEIDRRIARMLRADGAPPRVAVVANKTDDKGWMTSGQESASLGLGAPLCCSAANGFGIDRLETVLWRCAGEANEAPPEPDMRLAIVGKRNAGKSTLINALAGEDRVIVSEIPGTTRDSIDVRFEMNGRSFLAIDTAGVRKRKSFANAIEHYAHDRMLQAIRQADVALLLLDARGPISQVDKKLSQELQLQYKPTVIVVNKWDTIDEGTTRPGDYLDYVTQQLRGLEYAPIVFISARRLEGLTDVVSMAFNLHRQASHREGTGRVNATIREIMQRRGPSSRLGIEAKLYYATQIAVRPPTIQFFVNRPELFAGRYERYLLNRLREAMPFSEVPIRLVFSRRARMSLEALKERARAREA